MTIQRQYNLPNCRLTLECLTEDTTTSLSDVRPLVSILMSAECWLEGATQPVGGGREFFESFVLVVSQYAQGFLSGIPAPSFQHPSGMSIQLHNLGRSLHRLQVYSGTSQTPETPPDFQIDLTTVQLFDLVEAVDQFLADGRTLPEFTIPLVPVSRRYAKAREPIVQRALPAILGISSVTLAALAFFVVPVPEVSPPKNLIPQTEESESSNDTPAGTPSPSRTTSPNPEPSPATTPEGQPTVPEPSENLESTLTPSTVTITDPAKLQQLQKSLYEKVDEAWNQSITQDLEFRVSVTEDGSIVDYQPINSEAEAQQSQTPLPQLLYLPVGEQTIQEPVADFKVVFKKEGWVLEVNPWD